MVKDIGEFDRLLAEFMYEYNARIHSSLKESPNDRFKIEKDALKTNHEVTPAMLYKNEIRRVSNDGYIIYPVAMSSCLQNVRVETELGKIIKVYEMGGSLIAEHKVRLFDKGIMPPHPEHEVKNEEYIKKKGFHRAETVKKFINSFGPSYQTYVEGLRRSVTANMYWHIEEIMKYTLLYSISDIKSVLDECIDIGAYHKNSVRRLLECKASKIPPIEILNEFYVPSSAT